MTLKSEISKGDCLGQTLPQPNASESEIEIRPIFEIEDFGEALNPELRAQEERLRAEVEKRWNN